MSQAGSGPPQRPATGCATSLPRPAASWAWNHARFALLNLAAAGLWAASFVAAGWYATEWLGAENLGHVIGVLGLAALVAIAVRLWARRERVAGATMAANAAS
jgi:membrane protein DedA with SNARE-associated domain